MENHQKLSPTTPLVPAIAYARLIQGVEAVGALADVPMLTVDLGCDESCRELLALASTVPCVFVGIAPEPYDAPPELDVLLTSAPDPPRPWAHCPGGIEIALEGLANAVRQSPLASVTLVQLLRFSEHLGIRDALVAESLAYATLQAGPEFARWLEGTSRPSIDESEEPAVILHRTGASLAVVLNRPQRRNAFSARMRDELVAALQMAVLDSSIKEVHLRGAGPSFCSGGDLAEFGTTPNPTIAHNIRMTRSAAAWLDECAERATGHLHGACIGAGIELAAFAARVVAHPNTFIRLPEIEMGLIPGAGGTVSITRRAGRQRTTYLALSGAPLDAETGHHWGLIDELSDSRDQLMS